jgi:hypothetical protein
MPLSPYNIVLVSAPGKKTLALVGWKRVPLTACVRIMENLENLEEVR